MTAFTITVPGQPVGKARPRFVRATGRTYTPAETMRAEERVRTAWDLAGCPRLADVPLSVTLEVVVERPAGHFKRDGSLSAAGLRAGHYPVKKPDLDNVLKLVADSLNDRAYKDDAQIVRAMVSRRWAVTGEHARLLLTVSEMTGGVHVLSGGARAAA
jgi:Holliday junction resolvase RusA-like endonuclease